jgi:putative ATP-binding cassette transporter
MGACVIEASSALDLSSEAAMYELLMEQNITYLSIGHRPSLVSFHNKKLVLAGGGTKPRLEAIRHDKVAPDQATHDGLH